MGFIIIAIVLTIITGAYTYWYWYSDINNDFHEFCTAGCSVIVSVFDVVLLCFLIAAAVVNIIGPSSKQNLQVTYDSLTYQHENNIYDNDNDLGLKELHNQIQSYNSTVTIGRELQDNFWVGLWYADIYDDLPVIELK